METQKAETAVVKHEPRAVGFSMRLVPNTFDEAMKLAGALAKSNLVPKDMIGRPEACLVAIGFGMELGLPPLQAVQNIMVVNGRPTLWGDAVMALVYDSGKLETIDEDPPDVCMKNQSGRCTVKRIGGTEKTYRFTMEDAKRASLLGKDAWRNYPGRMLQLRARSWALRDNFADVLKGMIPREEADDMPEKRPVVRIPQEKPSILEETMQAVAVPEIITTEMIHDEPTPGDAQEPVFDDPISMEERAEIFKMLSAGKVDLTEWKKYVEDVYHVGSSAELPKSKLDDIKAWITDHVKQ
jgi:hypothetical protein